MLEHDAQTKVTAAQSAHAACVERHGWWFDMLAIITLLLGACCGGERSNSASALALAPPELQRLESIAPRMGMQARIVLFAADRARGKAAADAALDEIARLDAALSDYRDDSEVAKVNAAAGGEPVRVSEAFITVLQRAQEVSRVSDGAFDVTIGPVTQLWRAAKQAGRSPSQAEIDAAHALVNWRDMEVDATARTVRLTLAGMRLDFGGIGKGFAADRALHVLQEHGVSRALVALAGDIRLGDSPPGKHGWAIALSDGVTQSAATFELANCGVSTSGDAEQFLEIDGQRHSHIIDPHNGIGLTGRIAVTVIARDATASDALSTAISVMGAERGMAMIERIDGAAARIVIANAPAPRVQHTARFPRLSE